MIIPLVCILRCWRSVLKPDWYVHTYTVVIITFNLLISSCFLLLFLLLCFVCFCYVCFCFCFFFSFFFAKDLARPIKFLIIGKTITCSTHWNKAIPVVHVVAADCFRSTEIQNHLSVKLQYRIQGHSFLYHLILSVCTCFLFFYICLPKHFIKPWRKAVWLKRVLKWVFVLLRYHLYSCGVASSLRSLFSSSSLRSALIFPLNDFKIPWSYRTNFISLNVNALTAVARCPSGT